MKRPLIFSGKFSFAIFTFVFLFGFMETLDLWSFHPQYFGIAVASTVANEVFYRVRKDFYRHGI